MILVSGATGLVGGMVARRLLETGRAVSRSAAAATPCGASSSDGERSRRRICFGVRPTPLETFVRGRLAPSPA